MSAPAKTTRTAPQATAKPGQAYTLDQVIDATVAARSAEYVPFMGKEKITLSVPIVLKYLCTPTRSGKVCDERQAVKFIMLCKARGLNPFEGDAYIVGYDSQDGPQFSLITAHQAFLKRAEVHPEYDGMESGVIVQNGDEIVNREGDLLYEGDLLLGGWSTIYFKNRKFPMKKRLDFKTFNTGKSRWSKDPAGMIVKCAEADALRSAFPNTLGGMYLEDELVSVAESMPTPTPAPRGIPTGRTVLPKTAPPPAPMLAQESQSEPDVPTDGGNGELQEERPASDEIPSEAPDETPPADPGDDAAARAEQHLLELDAKVREAISKATNQKSLGEAARVMTRARGDAPESLQKEWVALYAEKNKEITAAKNKA